MTKTTPKPSDATSSKNDSRLSRIFEAAETYGARSFDNYAQIRSVAETVRDLLCRWLHKGDEPCVYLVPPEGPFQAENYQSGAFSVSVPKRRRIDENLNWKGKRYTPPITPR